MKKSFLLGSLLLLTLLVNAQTKSKNQSRSSASTHAFKNWGIGLRLGDPTGVSAKKYLPGGRALEFNLGGTSYRGVDYRDDFYDRDKFSDYDYLNYDREGAISFQVHYLFQKDIPDVENLQWYWGFGGQIRSKSFRYNYRFRNYYGNGPGDYTWVYGSDKVTDIDFGADGVIGLEYHISNAPISIFADVNVLLELLDDPLTFYGQGGIGVRYNLK